MKRASRDGVTLAYDEAGAGAPPLLLVHGAMNDHSYFDPQVEHFSRRHRTVAVDLRGHGGSDKPEQEYTIPGFADDLAWLCGELSLHRPVVVGHSMGGLVALELGARGLPSAIAILDTPILPPGDFAGALGGFAQAMQTPQYGEVIGQFLSQFVGFDDQPERRERLVAEMSSVSQHVIASAMRHYVAYDTGAAAAACKVPVLYVGSGPPLTDLDRFRALCPQLMAGQTVGSGHYHQLEVPEQVNAMLDRFMAVAIG